MQVSEGDVAVGGLHAYILTRRNIRRVGGDRFSLHVNAAACGNAVLKGVDHLLAALIAPYAGRHGDVTLSCGHVHVALSVNCRAVVIDIAAGAGHIDVAARRDTRAHAVANVVDISIRDQRHVAFG